LAISTLDLLKLLKNENIDFFTGVPDSLLKYFSYSLSDHIDQNNHIIAANEGNAIAIAAGYHIATNKIPVVYMQNSGLGNAINPLLSLCDPEVYSIPMLLMIGWRGQSGHIDANQHKKMGRIQEDILKTLELPFETITGDQNDFDKIKRMINLSKSKNEPAIILVQKDSFLTYPNNKNQVVDSDLTREQALRMILSDLPNHYFTVCSTGKISREVYEIRDELELGHNHDFLTVGSMGHCSSIALGLSLGNPSNHIICIDGDGSLIMHMGSLATMAKVASKNIHYVLINNFAHESVGGQETASKYVDISRLAESCKFKNYYFANNYSTLNKQWAEFIKEPFSFFEIRVMQGARQSLGRPKLKLNLLKEGFKDLYIDN